VRCRGWEGEFTNLFTHRWINTFMRTDGYESKHEIPLVIVFSPFLHRNCTCIMHKWTLYYAIDLIKNLWCEVSMSIILAYMLAPAGADFDFASILSRLQLINTFKILYRWSIYRNEWKRRFVH
jgi:hypothetical protein